MEIVTMINEDKIIRSRIKISRIIEECTSVINETMMNNERFPAYLHCFIKIGTLQSIKKNFC